MFLLNLMRLRLEIFINVFVLDSHSYKHTHTDEHHNLTMLKTWNIMRDISIEENKMLNRIVPICWSLINQIWKVVKLHARIFIFYSQLKKGVLYVLKKKPHSFVMESKTFSFNLPLQLFGNQPIIINNPLAWHTRLWNHCKGRVAGTLHYCTLSTQINHSAFCLYLTKAPQVMKAVSFCDEVWFLMSEQNATSVCGMLYW